MTTANRKKLGETISRWVAGYRTTMARPPLSTLNELMNIYEGTQTTTINSDVINVFDRLSIPYEVEGIGWRII
jgi:hypothetical protein